MNRMRAIRIETVSTRLASIVLGAAIACGVMAVPASAQAVTASDLTNLETMLNDAAPMISTARNRNDVTSLNRELAELRDEVTYLRVRLRKEGTVPRSDYLNLRDRVAAFDRRVRGDRQPARSTTEPAGVETSSTVRRGAPGEIVVGQQLDVRLQHPLSSETAQVEDRFEATTFVDLLQGERVLVPAGSVLRGVVRSVQKAGRLERKASLTLAFDEITIEGTRYPIRATVVEALEGGGYREDVGKIGTGAGVGAVIGGIIGGMKGALAGILIGAGGTIAATEGQNVELAPGTVLRVRFDEPLVVGSRR
jgi:hypothetical protein